MTSAERKRQSAGEAAGNRAGFARPADFRPTLKIASGA